MTKEVSPEEYQQMVANGQAKNSSTARPVYSKFIVPAVILLIGLLIGFVGGAQYQKGKATNSQTAAAGGNQTGAPDGFGQFGGGNGTGMRRGGGSFGTVSAISDSSITINDTRSGSAQTFKITGSTTVTNDSANASVSDIKTGDTVMIRTSTDDTSTATSILLNPSFGGAPGGGQAPNDSTDSTDSGSTSGSTTI